jgi:hypothetical protein
MLLLKENQGVAVVQTEVETLLEVLVTAVVGLKEQNVVQTDSLQELRDKDQTEQELKDQLQLELGLKDKDLTGLGLRGILQIEQELKGKDLTGLELREVLREQLELRDRDRTELELKDRDLTETAMIVM